MIVVPVVTELYTKAADQLGSDKAPVRLAGLYALERLAQDNPNQRQTIVNVHCAYLRIPFEPSRKATPKRSLWNVSKRRRPAAAARGRHDPEEELLVRQTVQSILSDHVFTTHMSTEWPRRSMPPAPTFWPDIDLDLQGATLVNFMLQGVVRDANFSNVRFIGTANFAHASFDGHVYFSDARFEDGHAHFFGTWFGLRAVFINTDFSPNEAVFKGATFCGMTFFRGAELAGGASFADARVLVDFNANWGDKREWPRGWTERSLGPAEKMPLNRWGRWKLPADQPPPGDGTWALVVRDDEQ